MVQHSNRRGRVVIQMRWVYLLSSTICSDRQGGCKSWRGHRRGPGSAHSERPRRGEAELHQGLDPAQVPASTFCKQQPRKERDWGLNQPAVILWNKRILMRGAWQPHGRSTCAHLLLPSPPPTRLLSAAQDPFSTSQRCCTGGSDTRSGERTQVERSPVLLHAKSLWCVCRGATCVSLLEWGREVSWMLPMSSGLLVTLQCVSCIQCRSLPKALGRPLPPQDKKKLCKERNHNFTPASLAAKINSINQGD